MKSRIFLSKAELYNLNLLYQLGAIVIFCGITLIANLQIGAGNPIYIRALEQYLSPINFFSLLLPLLPLFLSYKIITPYWFTDFREWQLIRGKTPFWKKQFIAVAKNCLLYTFGAYFSSVLLLLAFTGNVRTLPVTTGIVSIIGPFLGTIILLVTIFLINYGIMLLPLLLALVLRKSWQVLVIATILYFFLPIILFSVSVLPEQMLPINIYYQLLNSSRSDIEAIVSSVTSIVGFIVIEVGLIFTVVRIKERKEY